MSFNGTKEKNPCYKCGDRTETCHADCKRYDSWRQEYRERNYQQNLHINPYGCSYFKSRIRTECAAKSKKRYR